MAEGQPGEAHKLPSVRQEQKPAVKSSIEPIFSDLESPLDVDALKSQVSKLFNDAIIDLRGQKEKGRYKYTNEKIAEILDTSLDAVENRVRDLEGEGLIEPRTGRFEGKPGTTPKPKGKGGGLTREQSLKRDQQIITFTKLGYTNRMIAEIVGIGELRVERRKVKLRKRGLLPPTKGPI